MEILRIDLIETVVQLDWASEGNDRARCEQRYGVAYSTVFLLHGGHLIEIYITMKEQYQHIVHKYKSESRKKVKRVEGSWGLGQAEIVVRV